MPDLHAEPRHPRSTVFQAITLPAADQGPRRDDGTVAAGFDHTPVGAALAAIQASVRMSVAPDTQWPTIGQRMLAPGPGRDAWAVARAQISITAPADTPLRLQGYRVHSYTPGRAEIAIYARQPDTSLTCNTETVIWQNSDWKLLLPDQLRTQAVTSVPAVPADMVALTLH
ncbi:hypothetical protein [Nocardia vaccinii]|uniref:hypothetical protein n=1 Tax=Nocardia vaccinii TaxID=1822 RepID=UPI0009FFFE0F|nr:hypothetical protein [Nocardia vaccinii]